VLKKSLLIASLLLLSSFTTPANAIDAKEVLGPVARIQGVDGRGSGFFTSPSHVVTARHVAEKIMGKKGVYIFDSLGNRHRVVKISMSYDADAAMIEVDEPNDKIPLAKVQCRMPELFETLLAVGHPLEYKDIISPVMVVGFTDERDLDDVESVVVAGATGPGMSGGPVIDKNGFVIALVSSRSLFSRDGGKNLDASDFSNMVPLITVRELCVPQKAGEEPAADETNHPVPPRQPLPNSPAEKATTK
jgi:S1-C subfamily serine protease